MLRPHADQCDRTAEGERETEVTELPLERHCRQKQWEAGEEDILNCLPLSRLVALRWTLGKSKVAQVPVYLRQNAVPSSASGAFHRYYSIFVTGQQAHLQIASLEKKKKMFYNSSKTWNN